MPKLYLQQLKPGMTLLKPVTNSSGMTLLSEGTELNEELIARLQRLAVESVYIQRENQPERPREELLAELDTRFKKTENEPYMALLKRLFQEHVTGLYAKHEL